MPSGHALLSPSSSERWMQCPASIDMASRVIEVDGEVESVYAREGTLAHAIAEIEVSREFKLIDSAEYLDAHAKWINQTPAEWLDDMRRYADMYVDVIVEIVDENPNASVLVEQRMDTGVPFCWGTADCVVVSPTSLHVIDYKYGQGIAVSARDNSQLKLYGVAALDTFGIIGETETVAMSIFQPRLGQRSMYSMSAEDLRDWRDNTVIPKANEALGENPSFGPSESACRFCPAAGECKPRMLHITRQDFGDPDLLTPEEIAEALGRIDELKAWCNALEVTALQKAYSEGVPLPGWKVVLSGGRRSIPDAESAIQVLIDAGYPADLTARVGIKPLGELERLIGKKELPDLLGDLLIRSEGKPSLVPEDDRRPAINPEVDAIKDFSSQG